MDFLKYQVFGISAQRWLIALAVLLVTRIILGWMRRALSGRLGAWLQRLPGKYDDAIVRALADTRSWFLWSVSLYAALAPLAPSQAAKHAARVAVISVSLVQLGLWGQSFIKHALASWSESREASGERVGTAAAAITFISSLVIWSLVFLLTLQNAGIEIGALLAGLGVGGIAAALALQTVLGDLFASLSIYTDRPFDIGDFIIVDDYMGTVERVGLRSTRLSSLGGEHLVLPNGALMKTNIRNYRRMSERRVVLQVGVVYDTPYDKLRTVPDLLKQIIEGEEGVRFDRAHFSGYGDWSLNFELVYYVNSADYNEHMDRQQSILFEIFRRFEQSGIEFAFPTRTLVMKTDAASGSAQRAVAPRTPAGLKS